MEGLVAYNFEPEYSEVELSEIENQLLGGDNTQLQCWKRTSCQNYRVSIVTYRKRNVP